VKLASLDITTKEWDEKRPVDIRCFQEQQLNFFTDFKLLLKLLSFFSKSDIFILKCFNKKTFLTVSDWLLMLSCLTKECLISGA